MGEESKSDPPNKIKASRTKITFITEKQWEKEIKITSEALWPAMEMGATLAVFQVIRSFLSYFLPST